MNGEKHSLRKKMNHTIVFNHNTNFTDINWKYLMTLAAKNMSPNLGQKLELKLINTRNKTEFGMITIPSI